MTITCTITHFPKPPIACVGPLRDVCIFAENHVRGAQARGEVVGIEFTGPKNEKYLADAYMADVFLELIGDVHQTIATRNAKVRQ